MALQMSFTAEDGTTYPACYIPISAIILATSGATICTNFFADEATYHASGLPLTQPAFSCDLSVFDAGAPFESAYTFLLTLPDFAGAVIVRDN